MAATPQAPAGPTNAPRKEKFELLRSSLQALGRHKKLALFLSALLIGGGLALRQLKIRSEGIVSDPIRRQTIVESVYGIGTVTATRSWQIKPGVVSTIDALFVKEGDNVRKGQRLVTVDNIEYRAPFAGTVCYLPYKERENTFPQLPILSLVDLSDRYIVVSLEQQGALALRQGQKAKLSFDTMRGRSYDGVVASVYSFNSNFLARVDSPDLPPNVLPDMTADVAIEIRAEPNVLVVPAAALDRGSLWIKREGSLVRNVEVKTGIVDKGSAEIVSGDLREGDRVLIKSQLGP